MKRGYKAARSHGRAAYEIEANADLGHVMASGQALPILKDGKATAQVGALTNYQDGRGLVRFSRSEKGQEAENLYASGNAQLSISTTRTRSGQDRIGQSPYHCAQVTELQKWITKHKQLPNLGKSMVKAT